MSSLELNDLKLTRLSAIREKDIHAFLTGIFTKEQGIPAEMIPIKADKVYWWGIVGPDKEILGAVAIWKEMESWHWGRFSIHPKIRGRGLGRELAILSFSEAFKLNIQSIVIDARDKVVGLVESLGGVVCGETTPFFSGNITPMKLERESFVPNDQN